MGTGHLWYFPDPNGTIEKVDLGEDLSDLQFEVRVDQSVSEGLTGQQATTHFSARGRVRVVVERFTSAATARKLFAVADHLKRGGLVAVAEDETKAIAAFLDAAPTRGDSAFLPAIEPWPYNTSAGLSVGDELELIGSQPLAYREFLLSSSTYNQGGLTSISTSETARYNYRDEGARWVLLRHRGFWPMLRLPKEERNQPILTHDHRISYTFDVQLEEAIDAFEVMAIENDSVFTDGTGDNLPQILNRPGPGIGFGWVGN